MHELLNPTTEKIATIKSSPSEHWEKFFSALTTCTSSEVADCSEKIYANIQEMCSSVGIDEYTNWLSIELKRGCYTDQKKSDLFFAFQKHYCELRSLAHPAQQMILLSFFLPSISGAYFDTLGEEYKDCLNELVVWGISDPEFYKEVSQPSELQRCLELLIHLRKADSTIVKDARMLSNIIKFVLQKRKEYPLCWESEVFYHCFYEQEDFQKYLNDYLEKGSIFFNYTQQLFAFYEACQSERRWSNEKIRSIQQYCFRSIIYCAYMKNVDQSIEACRNKIVNYLLDQAKNHFRHDLFGKIWRLLVDVFFVPLGILTFGRMFDIKKKCTGARTFLGERSARMRFFSKHVLERHAEEEMVSFLPSNISVSVS